jgi:hypothetical protein
VILMGFRLFKCSVWGWTRIYNHVPQLQSYCESLPCILRMCKKGLQQQSWDMVTEKGSGCITGWTPQVSFRLLIIFHSCRHCSSSFFRGDPYTSSAVVELSTLYSKDSTVHMVSITFNSTKRAKVFYARNSSPTCWIGIFTRYELSSTDEEVNE